MACNAKQVTISKIHFPSYLAVVNLFFMSLAEVLVKGTNMFPSEVQLLLFRSLQMLYNICVIHSALSPIKTDIDDCASHPCKNDGTCVDQVNGFNCSCAPGFNGKQCETGNYIQNPFSFIFSSA